MAQTGSSRFPRHTMTNTRPRPRGQRCSKLKSPSSVLLMLLAMPIVLPSVDAWIIPSLLRLPSASLPVALHSSTLTRCIPTSITSRRSVRGPTETETPSNVSAMTVFISAHTKLMQSICPRLLSCRMYSVAWESQMASLDDTALLLREEEFGALLARSKDPDDPSVGIATSCESIQNDTSLSVLLLPLHSREGTDWLVLSFNPSAQSRETQYTLLDNCITCLAAALNLTSHHHQDKKQNPAPLAQFLQAVRTPLGALRTFSKLLLRRMERDREGLSYELAKNVLIQSDQLVELLLDDTSERMESGGGGGTGWEMMNAQDGSRSEEEMEEMEEAEARGGLMRREGLGRSRSSTLCELRGVLAPVVSAAQLVSSRDGISFFFFQEEDLPKHVPLLDETLLQETLGTLVESALGYALEGAVAGGQKPVVTLDVRRLGGGGAEEGPSTTLVFLVQDNGVAASTTHSSPEFGTIRKDVERMGARLEIRASKALGGTQASLYIDCSARKAYQ